MVRTPARGIPVVPMTHAAGTRASHRNATRSSHTNDHLHRMLIRTMPTHIKGSIYSIYDTEYRSFAHQHDNNVEHRDFSRHREKDNIENLPAG